MKRPKISNALTVSQGQYGKFIAYADHLEQEIERLKSERVELVKKFDFSKLSFLERSKLGVWTTGMGEEMIPVKSVIQILEQFNKEKS